jgi:hypothetical protein
MNVLSEQGRRALEFVSAFGGNVDAAIGALEQVRPLVLAERMRELGQVMRTVTSTPTEAPAPALGATPAAGEPCPCGSGKALSECHAAESEAA